MLICKNYNQIEILITPSLFMRSKKGRSETQIPVLVRLTHMRLCVFVGLYICGIKHWFRDYALKSPNLCLGKSITVLLLGIAATNSVTKMKTTEHA